MERIMPCALPEVIDGGRQDRKRISIGTFRQAWQCTLLQVLVLPLHKRGYQLLFAHSDTSFPTPTQSI